MRNDPHDEEPQASDLAPDSDAPEDDSLTHSEADQAAKDQGRTLRRWGRRLVLTGFGILLVFSCAWLVISALLARRELTAIKSDLSGLRASITSGDVVKARFTANGIARHAHKAAQLTGDPIWSLAGYVPYLGSPFESVQTLARVADQLGTGVLPDLIEVSNELDPNHLRLGSSGIDVSKIATAAPLVHHSVLQLQQASVLIAGLPDKSWLSSLDNAKSSVLVSLNNLRTGLSGLDRATQVLPTMLGEGGVKRYFIGIMNESESRGLGGIPGAYVILTVNRGVANFERYGTDDALKYVDSGVKLGPEYDRRYANASSTEFFLNSTLSPHFPYVAKIWAATWEKATGQHVDGAIAIDPTALSYLLKVTGPATAPDGLKVGADNIVDLTESELYAKFAFDDQAGRKSYLLDIASAVDSQLLSHEKDAAGLVKAAFQGAQERRLLVWSADPAAEKVLQTTLFAGTISQAQNPFVGLVVNNGAATKLDYYLDRSLTWRRTGCGPTRQVQVTIKLTNNAPAKGLPYYVTSRYDADPSGARGDSRVQAVYYGTAGGALNSVTVDGVPSTVIPASELGHPTYFIDMVIPVGATKSIVMSLNEPSGSGPPIVLNQPLVRPMTINVNDAKCP